MTHQGENIVVLFYQVPSSTAAARQFVLRKLQASGAKPLVQGAWFLPNTAENRRKLQAIAALMLGYRGVAYVVTGAVEALVDGRHPPAAPKHPNS